MGRQLGEAVLSLSGDELWKLLEYHQGEIFYTAQSITDMGISDTRL